MPSRLLSATAACLLSLALQAQASVQRDDARAYASADGRLLYTESHWVDESASPAKRLVLYRCPGGQAFARKLVSASGSASAPDFAFEDGRDGYRQGVSLLAGRRHGYLQQAGRPELRYPLEVPADGVIDAGFDAAVRAHWHALSSGEEVRLRFLVPGRKRFYPVRIRRIGATTWNGIAAERLRMDLDQWYGFAVPPVHLVYARADRRLLEFSGTGDVRDDRGRNQQVRIAFAPASRQVAAAEMAAASAEKLTACKD
ncbi:MAG: hypothetical protein NVV60_08645 [Luteimonas sp.]|nr:hypothetical protein [Luteimonas sp.]